jgi:hypothetical protein
MNRPILAGLIFAVVVGALPAATPAYLATALRGFPSGSLPSDTAYEMEITRNGHRVRERFDPARPVAERWTLLEFAGRSPTPGEIVQHRATRAKGGATASFQADFAAADIDRASLRLESEDASTAVYTGAFTVDAAERDGFLARSVLRLTVDKRRAEVAAYELRLQRAFSPVLGVKIYELVAGAEFHRPPGLGALLPSRTWSRLNGRIFFSSTREDLEARYSGFAKAALPAAR